MARPPDRLFTIVGGVNVKRNMTSLNVESRSSMKNAQLLTVDQLSGIEAAFDQIKPESSVLIFAAFSEILTQAEFCGTILGTIDPVLNHVHDLLRALISSRSELKVLLSPPLYLNRPAWYRNGLSQIGSRFSSCFSSLSGMWLLPGFSSQELLPDGVHLTPVSGLHYLLQMFDQSESILSNLADAPEKHLLRGLEFSRQVNDRLIYLERDHDRLSHVVDLKLATSAEFDDWTLNRSEEDWIVVTGLPRLSASLSRGDWQSAAREQVAEAIRHVLRANRTQVNFSVLLVVNAVRGRTSGRTIYNVRLSSVESAKRIRELFSGFFRRQNPVRCPSGLSGVGFRNKITLETRVRLAIMKQLGENYKSSNSGSSFFVRGYESRPQLVLIPPKDASDSRPRTLNFISAGKSLPRHLSDENLIPIYRVIGNNLRDKLRSLFVILNDDDHDRVLDLVRKQDSQPRLAPSASVSSYAGVVVGSGSGASSQAAPTDLRALPASFLLLPPPPPPKEVESPALSVAPARSSSGRSRKKRQASSGGKAHSSKRSKKNRRRSPSSSSSSSSSSSTSSSSSSSSYSRN